MKTNTERPLFDQDKGVKSEEIESKLDLSARYQPIMPVHFEELNRLWPADTRIPSFTSRRAWALARGLNPNNVNNWWYRRRKVAKKLRITIRKDTYELNIGNPPAVPTIVKPDMPSMADVSAVVAFNDADENAKGDDSPMFASSDTHIPSSDDNFSPLDSLRTTVAPSSPVLSEILLAKTEGVGNNAYIQHMESKNASFISLFSTASSASHTSAGTLMSQLVSNITSRIPSPTPILWLESERLSEANDSMLLVCDKTVISDIRADRDALWASFKSLEEFYPDHVLPTKNFGSPLSSCAAQPFSKSWTVPSALEDMLLTVDDTCYEYEISLHDAPWCFNGFRIHFDGSLAGICSCYSPISSPSP